MAVTITSEQRNFPTETQEWLNTKDYFASYCYLNYNNVLSFSTDSSDEINPFKFSQWLNSAVPVRLINSPDLIYNQDDGTIEVSIAGNYLIIFSAFFQLESGTDTGCIQRIKKITNAGSMQTMITTTPIFAHEGRDPKQSVTHTVLALEAGNKILVTGEADDSDTIRLSAGTSLFIQRLNGHFSSARYTADTNTITDEGNVNIFGSDEGNGGTVTSTSSGTSFTASTGKFTPSEERMFVNLQSTIALSTGGDFSNARHRSTLNGSNSSNGYMNDISVGVSEDDDPFNTQNLIMKAIPSSLASQPQFKIESNVPDYKLMQGTATTIYDISNNGSLPSTYFCLVVGSTSNALASSAAVWDEDNWGTFTTLDPNDNTNKATGSTIGGNKGITYSSSNGRFTVEEAGDYVIMQNLMVKDRSSSAETILLLGANTTTYADRFYVETGMDPLSLFSIRILRMDAGDFVTSSALSLSAKIDLDSTIIIYKVGPSMTKQPGDNEFFDGATRFSDTTQPVGQPIVKTDDTIDSADKGDQRDRRTEQSPFRMSVNGPLTLRGRARSSLPFNVAAGKRGGKK